MQLQWAGEEKLIVLLWPGGSGGLWDMEGRDYRSVLEAFFD